MSNENENDNANQKSGPEGEAQGKPEQAPAAAPPKETAEAGAATEASEAKEAPEAQEAKPEKAKADKPPKGDKGDKGKQAKGDGKGGGKDKNKDKDKGGKGKAAKPAAAPTDYKREQPPRLKRIYEAEVRQKLREEFGYTNPMQVPRLVKISVNMGLGKATQNPKMMDSAVEELRAVTGRAPVVTLAKKDIATFKLRRGHKIGAMVTLRREAMWEFLDRFLNVALPRVRDFRGLSAKAFDGRGNYSIGVKEQIIFPEIEYDSIDSVKGLNVTIVTTAKTDAEGRALLRLLGVPFRQAAGQAETAAQGAQA
jgi:large subunit ribosomal protein L5